MRDIFIARNSADPMTNCDEKLVDGQHMERNVDYGTQIFIYDMKLQLIFNMFLLLLSCNTWNVMWNTNYSFMI